MTGEATLRHTKRFKGFEALTYKFIKLNTLHCTIQYHCIHFVTQEVN